MRSKQKKKSQVRSFERDARIERLREAGIIRSPDEIPGDAIPAGLEYIQRTRSSLSLDQRPPYYRDLEFRCADCGRHRVWLADDQCHWYEQVQGSPYGTAKRCVDCRRKRRGVRGG